MNVFHEQSRRLNMQWERAIQKGSLAIRLVQLQQLLTMREG